MKSEVVEKLAEIKVLAAKDELSEQAEEIVAREVQRPSHSLISRRDFLAQGILGFSAMLSLPAHSFLDLEGLATQCGADPSAPQSLPFLVFDMAGGAALPANFLVGKAGGPEDLLAQYTFLGWNPRESGALNKDFGLPMSAKYSGLLKGILEKASPNARKNLRLGSFCHFAQDDSTSNRLNAACLAMKAGTRGVFLSNGLGVEDSPSGGNSSPVFLDPVFRPSFARSIEDVLASTNFGGPALEGVSFEAKKSLALSSLALRDIQAPLLEGTTEGKVLSELSECAYKKSLSFLENVSGLDPRTNPVVQSVYGISQETPGNSPLAMAAAISFNSLAGHSGPSTWTLGGCDYHDGTQETGDKKDKIMGDTIGLCLELAHRLQKPFFFQLLTDGGCDSGAGNRSWRGDSGDKCMTVIGYYDPKGPAEMIRKQVGHYTDGQGAERNTLLGSEPALVGYAVLANYLNLIGRLGDFRSLAPGIFATESQLKSVLIFKEKAS